VISNQGIRWLALTAAMVWPTALVLIYWVALSRGQVEPNRLQQLAYALGKVVQFGFPLVVVWWLGEGWDVSPSRLGSGVWLGLASGGLAAAGMLGGYYVPVTRTDLLAQAPGRVHAMLVEFGIHSFLPYLFLSIFYVAFHSLLEEYYWRWFVFGQLRRLVSPTTAIVVSSLAFMAHHVVLLNSFMPGRFWLGVLPASLAIAFAGAFWAWLYQRSGSLLGPWLSHLLGDAAIFTIG